MAPRPSKYQACLLQRGFRQAWPYITRTWACNIYLQSLLAYTSTCVLYKQRNNLYQESRGGGSFSQPTPTTTAACWLLHKLYPQRHGVSVPWICQVFALIRCTSSH